ncbi:TlpA family protein disulfide reductase [Desulfovibrio sp. OttesenSCG-928-G15]|nr:TlpA family protein disulfide reductase [Desulfovibrio sp. OttesenSCG-928-G15]
MRRFFLCLSVLAVILCFGAADCMAASVNPSDIPTVDGAGFFKRVNAEKGKVVVVNVFASWCPPCRDEIPGLVNLRKLMPKDKVEFIGVSVDKEPKALANYMEEMNINYSVLLGKGDFIQRIRVRAVPQLLIYNPQGELVFNHQGLMDEADIRDSINEILGK